MVNQAVEHLINRDQDIPVGEIEPIELMGDTVIIQGNDSLPVCPKDTITEQDMIKGETAIRLSNDRAE